ncbi:hypothetical protein WMY93_023155 [Mugilogobius chulae]|uniref:BLOC-1-related complex subunit 5 n=1 Tax=Mugilogobius chulae TaxID=88201 RepID=A0AAW0N7Z4_9GOBI
MRERKGKKERQRERDRQRESLSLPLSLFSLFSHLLSQRSDLPPPLSRALGHGASSAVRPPRPLSLSLAGVRIKQSDFSLYSRESLDRYRSYTCVLHLCLSLSLLQASSAVRPPPPLFLSGAWTQRRAYTCAFSLSLSLSHTSLSLSQFSLFSLSCRCIKWSDLPLIPPSGAFGPGTGVLSGQTSPSSLSPRALGPGAGLTLVRSVSAASASVRRGRGFDQNALVKRIKEMDLSVEALFSLMQERQKRYAKYAEQIQKVNEMSMDPETSPDGNRPDAASAGATEQPAAGGREAGAV